MKIGILGSGNVGGTLGARWARAGHTVVFGARKLASPEMQQLQQRAGANASIGTVAEAGACEVVLLATPWEAAEDALRKSGDLRGKVLIDATNPLLPQLAGLALGTTTSGAEQVAAWTGARVVKAFNTIGYNVMENPRFGSEAAALLFCGDDAEAKATVRKLAVDLGFAPEDVGPLTQARLLEPMAMLWISMAVFHGFGREIAFHLLRRV